MKAYYQGEIDYFCGVYAIINAVRIAAQPVHDFTYHEGCLFFQHLVSFLYKNEKFLKVLHHGTSYQLMYELLAETKKYLFKQYRLKLHYKKLLSFSDLPDKNLWIYIQRYLREPNTSTILRLHNTALGDHWTVAQRQTSNILKLFDSYFYPQINLKRTTFKPYKHDGLHHIQRPMIILIKIFE